MGRFISGKLKCTIEFNEIYVEDGQSEIDVIFPDGWEGEMTSDDLDIETEIDTEDEED